MGIRIKMRRPKVFVSIVTSCLIGFQLLLIGKIHFIKNYWKSEPLPFSSEEPVHIREERIQLENIQLKDPTREDCHYNKTKNDTSSRVGPNYLYCHPAMGLVNCVDLHDVPGIKVVQRIDLFESEANRFSKETGLGSVIFHRPEAEWISESLLFDRTHPPFYPKIGSAIRDALNCTTTTCSTREECKKCSSVDYLEHSCAGNHQSCLPPVEVRSFYAEDHNVAIPSVAIVKHAFADLGNGKIQTCSHVIQFNDCNALFAYHPEPLNFARFLHDDDNATDTNPAELTVPNYDKVVFLGGHFAKAYFHRLVDHFARFSIIVDLVKNDQEIIVVAPKGLSLLAEQIYGIPPERFVWSQNQFYANRMYIPDPTRCGRLDPLVAAFTRDAILKALMASMNNTAEDAVIPHHHQKHILIVRRRGNRELINHDEFVSQLRQTLPVGETVVVYDDNNLPPPGLPQFRMFASAKIVVAPHGAGLAHLLACSAGTKVVEFLSPQRRMTMLSYLALSSALNLEYHPLRMNRLDPSLKYKIDDVPKVVDIVTTMVRSDAGSHRMAMKKIE